MEIKREAWKIRSPSNGFFAFLLDGWRQF